jgi:hypothetical protein
MTMMGGVEVKGHNIYHRRGDTGYLDVSLFLGDERYDLRDGDSGLFTVKKKKDSSDAVYQKVMTEDGGFILEPEDTAGLEPGVYYYDVQITLSSGDVNTIAIGKYKLLGDITTGVMSA